MFLQVACVALTSHTHKPNKKNSKCNTKFCLLDQIIKMAAYCVHGEGGLPSPGVVSSRETVLFIQGVRQTPFC